MIRLILLVFTVAILIINTTSVSHATDAGNKTGTCAALTSNAIDPSMITRIGNPFLDTTFPFSEETLVALKEFVERYPFERPEEVLALLQQNIAVSVKNNAIKAMKILGRRGRSYPLDGDLSKLFDQKDDETLSIPTESVEKILASSESDQVVHRKSSALSGGRVAISNLDQRDNASLRNRAMAGGGRSQGGEILYKNPHTGKKNYDGP